MHSGIVSPCSSGPLADLLPESNRFDLGCGVHFMATLVRALIERRHRVSVITLSTGDIGAKTTQGLQTNFLCLSERTRRRMRDLYRVERQHL